MRIEFWLNLRGDPRKREGVVPVVHIEESALKGKVSSGVQALTPQVPALVTLHSCIDISVRCYMHCKDIVSENFLL